MTEISVILPTYNRCLFLKQAIESVLAQTFTDYELIVVDDGSTDETPELLASYGEKIITIRQENKGVSAARNAGIQKASARLIAFLDSDDLWMPEKLAVQKAFFDARPNDLICQTEEIWIRNGIRVNPKIKHKKQSGMIFEPSLHLCLVSPSAVMIRRELFDAVGMFDENILACEDYDLWLRTACQYPVYLISDPLILKQGGHADQLSKSPGLDQYRIRSLLNLLESGILTQSQYQASACVLKMKCRIFANGCLKRGKKQEADYYFGITLRFPA